MEPVIIMLGTAAAMVALVTTTDVIESGLTAANATLLALCSPFVAMGALAAISLFGV